MREGGQEAEASPYDFGLGSNAFLGILLLRAWTAAPHPRRIRAGLRLARLNEARVFTEHAAGKGSRPVASRVT